MLESGLRGNIDHVRFGRGMLELSGWICRTDGTPALEPLTLRLGDITTQVTALRVRPDLVDAGIAQDRAAFDKTVIGDWPELASSVIIHATDASGASCELHYATLIPLPFVPRGFLERINAEVIAGWVFDPGLYFSGGRAVLLVNSCEIMELSLSVCRDDLPFELDGGSRLYGFQADVRPLMPVLKELVRGSAGVGQLILASSGFILCSAEIRLEGDDLTVMQCAVPGQQVVKVRESDFLSKFERRASFPRVLAAA